MRNTQEVQREFTQWKQIYSNLSIEPNFSMFSSNFSSHNDDFKDNIINDDLVKTIAEQFAMSVFMELQDDLKSDQMRLSQTAKGVRSIAFRAPVVTAQKPRKYIKHVRSFGNVRLNPQPTGSI